LHLDPSTPGPETTEDATQGPGLPPWVERGVFVYGPRKAGTTLFQTLLDGGDQLFAYPAELKVKSFVRKPHWNDDIEKYYERSRIKTVASPHLSQDRYAQLWAEALERRDLHTQAEYVRYDIAAVYASCDNAPAGIEMWCAKEIGTPTTEIVEFWRRMFPGGKILFITRDPLMVTRAVLNDRRRKGVQPSLRKIVYETCDPMRAVTAQARLLDDPNIFAIAYEDLIADTAGTMARVAAFLGVDYTPVFEAPTIFSDPVVVRTASQKTASVFQSTTTKWTDGLTWRERLAVWAFHTAASFLPDYNVDYTALRRRLRAPSAPKAA